MNLPVRMCSLQQQCMAGMCTAAPPTAANEVERQALKWLVAARDVVTDRVDDQAQELVVLQG